MHFFARPSIALFLLTAALAFAGCDLSPRLCNDSHEMRVSIDEIRHQLQQDLDKKGTWGMGCVTIQSHFKKFSSYQQSIRKNADENLRKAVTNCVGGLKTRRAERRNYDPNTGTSHPEFYNETYWDSCAHQEFVRWEYLQPGYNQADELISSFAHLQTEVDKLCAEFMNVPSHESYQPRTEALVQHIDKNIIGRGISIYVQAGCSQKKAFVLGGKTHDDYFATKNAPASLKQPEPKSAEISAKTAL